ncbi:MAG: hypothetical protein A2284_03675 [Deltaproteobacteria bacterium RIFOXYA12_FULL_61_11]|nr:MAG: hypothetical protein A2284_03675 [Deltaproteobacteria bacterium RIFOXYA12_FULL_61_11]
MKTPSIKEQLSKAISFGVVLPPLIVAKCPGLHCTSALLADGYTGHWACLRCGIHGDSPVSLFQAVHRVSRSEAELALGLPDNSNNGTERAFT